MPYTQSAHRKKTFILSLVLYKMALG